MKNIFSVILILCLFASCQKHEVEMVFDQNPETRMLERNAELRSKLLESPNGWKGSLRTSLNGSAYGFYMKFTENEEVSMVSDWNATAANTPRVSTYRVKFVMNTSLFFDTYNYITIMQDPNPAVNGGVSADGLRSDIEFEYIRSTADSIILRGKKYLNNLYLLKATAAEATSFTNGTGYSTSITAMNNFFNTTVNKYVLVNFNGTDVKVGFNFNIPSKLVSCQVLLPDQSVASANGGFAHGINEIYFNTPITIAGVTFVSVKVKTDGSYVAVDKNGKEYPILSNAVPVVPALNLFGNGGGLFVVPRATTFAGWGADFISRRATANTGVATWAISGSNLSLGTISFMDINGTSKLFTIRVNCPYASTSTNLDYQYRFAINTDNTFKFTYVSALNTNASTIYASLNALLAQRINVDKFTLSYYTDPATNASYMRFSSVENPTFVFTASY